MQRVLGGKQEEALSRAVGGPPGWFSGHDYSEGRTTVEGSVVGTSSLTPEHVVFRGVKSVSQD